jgi:hypothetical protein
MFLTGFTGFARFTGFAGAALALTLGVLAFFRLVGLARAATRRLAGRADRILVARDDCLARLALMRLALGRFTDRRATAFRTFLACFAPRRAFRLAISGPFKICSKS